MTFPQISVLRTHVGVFSSNKTDPDTAGRNRRSATRCHVARGPLTLPPPSGRGDPFSPCGGEGEDEGCSLELHENDSIRNASGRWVSSKTGVPTRSAPRTAIKRASVSES